ncbi:sel1 repeat family protein [Oxalobacter vibrioformis]|uniref:Sel1 repeat family protein n=1 Tax=Oxalobacter vibrioformis TaxID=933080 RepID=A0A9E9LYH3_9BURK|nr:tetratricopeptide repeat protein [Oxalobacter vibrioformis]WAW09789.1 sel1 repeat family protein [Oxalobacter vibrioformis]
MKMRILGLLVAVFCTGFSGMVSAQDEDQQAPPQAKSERVIYSMKDALPVYREKAGQGDVDAQLMMGQIYAMGDIVDADMEAAFSWFMKAARQDNAEAQFKIAEMYLYGQGVERDFSHAEKWASESARQEYADGEYLLGLLYAEGKGVPEDWKKATIWLCRAANKGNQKSIDLLDTRTLTGQITSTRDGEGMADWCNTASSRLSGS